VCGLPVLVRNLLVIERGGFRRVLLVVDPADRLAVETTLARHPRIGIAILWIEDAGDSLAPVAAALKKAWQDAVDVLCWPGEISCGRIIPAVATVAVPPDGAVIGGAGRDQPDARLILIGGNALAANSHLSAARLAETLLRDHRGVLAAPEPQLIAVTSPEDAARAEARLLQSLRKEADGAFAQYDRCVSLAITSWLVRFPVAPNHATLVAGLVGMASGVLASRGGYRWLLAGALCYLASNLIDGIDGEIARAKLLESWFGQWCDTLADDLTNLVFLVGTAAGSYRTWHANVYLVLGATTAFNLLVIAAVMYHQLITVAHSGDLNAFKSPWENENGAGRASSGVVGRVRFLLRRDAFAYMAVLAAVLGQAWILVWLSAVGTTVIWLAWATYTIAAPLFQRSRHTAS
jgi:phosphatidylglycerophosphate synthase